MSKEAINKRYTFLSEKTCCISCGGAIDYAKAIQDEVCVDLGSGRGNDVVRLANQVGEKGFVYGVDISKGMIAKAERTLSELGITNAKILYADLEQLPLEDNSANVVISNCTINHAENKQAVWNEVFRILKPNGRFVVSDIYATHPIEAKYKNDPEAVAECWAGAVTRVEYFAMLEKAGFSDIQVLEESKPYAKGKTEVASITIYGKKKSK